MSSPDRLWFLFAAYSVIWILLALFLAHLARRHRGLEQELGELRARIGDTGSGGPAVSSGATRANRRA